MRHRLAFCLALLAPLALSAQEVAPVSPEAEADLTLVERWEADRLQVFDGTEVTLAEIEWIARPLVVFAASPNDPRFLQQMELLADRPEDLALRDVIVLVDTDPDVLSDLRKRFRPRGFMLALLEKDGTIAFRKPSPWDVREITRSIDKMPLRQQEIRDRRELSQ